MAFSSQPPQITIKCERIGIIGSGWSGRNWAMLYISSGYYVNLFDISQSRVDDALNAIKSLLDRYKNQGMLRGSIGAADQFQLIRRAKSLADCMEGAKLVQEAVVEDLKVKQLLFREMDSLAVKNQILCSSTSTFDPDEFSESISHRHQVIVTHLIYPPYFIPLTEVITSTWTSDAVRDRTMEILTEIGQKPVLCKKVTPGFVTNRLQYCILNECWKLVEDGVISPKEVDVVVRDGLAMQYAFVGPFESAYLSTNGIVEYCNRKRAEIEKVSDTFGPPPTWQGPLVHHLSRKLTSMVPDSRIKPRESWRDTCLLSLTNLKRDNPQ